MENLFKSAGMVGGSLTLIELFDSPSRWFCSGSGLKISYFLKKTLIRDEAD